MSPSIAPLQEESLAYQENIPVEDLATAAFDSSNMLLSIEPKDGKWLATNLVFQGAVTDAEE